ncbi:hypothetical protein V4D30_01615 [Thermodesulfovibrio sp. 3907-1M]|uniref:Transposase n=1 Tax=Thermodesulfovibrio autotrophicus TaxID=3118333 RepID=A0AAU8GXP0_9BACT
MKELIEIYAAEWIKAQDFYEASHQKIKAWKKAYERGKRTEMCCMKMNLKI